MVGDKTARLFHSIAVAALPAGGAGRGVWHCAASTRSAVHRGVQRREVPGQGQDTSPTIIDTHECKREGLFHRPVQQAVMQGSSLIRLLVM